MTLLQDVIPPKPLTDEEVLKTWNEMNDVIRLRMLTSEVLPSPMRGYRIGKRYDICIEKRDLICK
jgi:hypothetical protein